MKKRTAIIISISSDIGTAMGLRWLSLGWDVLGTYRTGSNVVDELKQKGVKLIKCDLLDAKSIKIACNKLCANGGKWDILVLCTGALEPIGAFKQIDFRKWEESIEVNFISQMRVVRELLPFRNIGFSRGPCVIFFAGAGTNSAIANYSAYIVSKLALIKMCELLDKEITDSRFTIIGSGWVKTKIHNATFKAGKKAGINYQLTKRKLAGDKCTSMKKVIDCCDWVIRSPRNLVSGRNFSVVFDKWGDDELKKNLSRQPDMYKLRRYGNDWLVR